MRVKIGMVGTSWWSDAMYMPALENHADATVVAVCGRNRERADAFAARWQVPAVFTDYAEMIATEALDAIVIATGNDSHYPITMLALEKGLHVLCEKPLALDLAEAASMAHTATEKNVTTLVPFTYRFMPTNRFLKQLIDAGYIGKPYHMAMRYYTGYARDGEYTWRFNKKTAGTGAMGDLGSHFLYIAEWIYGPIVALTCQTAMFVDRPDLDPDGNEYEKLEDSAYFLLEFENGAQGAIHVTSVAMENTAFGQRHYLEFHGSDGTLHSTVDWDNLQEVRGAKHPDGKLDILPIPDDIWGKARRDVVHETYKDVFRVDQLMVGEWVSAIVNKTDASPDFADGLRIQRLIAAAVQSAASGRRVVVEDVTE